MNNWLCNITINTGMSHDDIMHVNVHSVAVVERVVITF